MPPQEMVAAKKMFLNKEYKNAAESFSRIHWKTKKDVFRQKALLGMACSRMLLAGNTLQWQEALKLWQAFCENQTQNLSSEELCVFLTPVLKKWSYPKKKAKVEKEHEKKRKVKKEKNKKSITLKNGRSGKSDIFKVFLKQKKELKKLRRQIKVKDHKIKELNKKLKALEAIYQEIDRKKKGMNFP